MRGFSALLVSVVLAGCGGGATAVPSPSPTLPPCNFSSSEFGASVLVSPFNGAKGVPTNEGSVTIGYLSELVGLTVMLWPNPSALPLNPLVSGGKFVVSGSGTTLTATIPVLTPATQYAVETSTVRPAGSCAESVSWGFGSFST